MTALTTELPGDSGSIKRLRSEIALAAKTDIPVLLLGETGSGKELAARLIHAHGSRQTQPFVAVNIAALVPTLAAAEIVGHTKGAFTGATDRPGLFEKANGGTIFLDEIGEASLDFQAILLSILESRSVRRLGEATNREVDVRVIAATNRDVAAMVEAGEFRADLYTRIAAIQIRLPSLRERRADIPELAARILRKISKHLGPQLTLAPSAIEALQGYSFPGNFRELENLLERAAITASGPTIDASALGLPTLSKPKRSRSTPQLEVARRQLEGLQRELEALRATTITAQPIWQGRHFRIQHDYCFVLMPFADNRDLQTIYRDHVKPVVERAGLRCERADDIYDVSGVMQSVWEGISRARLVVADLTERNANVFYELGIAHTLGKPVIMLSQSIDFVPFDLRHLRCIVYTYTPRGATQLEQALGRTIKTALSSGGLLGTG